MDTSATSSNMADNRNGFDVPTYSAAKRRRENFSDNENKIVLDEVMANADKLFGENQLNAAGKAEIWEQIVQKVNEEGRMDRTVFECRKRLPEYKRKIKNIIKRARESGNRNIERILSKRQLRVANFFNMLSDTSNGAQDSRDDMSLDGESSTHSTEAIYIDLSGVFDDDFTPRTTLSASSGSAADAVDQPTIQSNEQTPSVQPDSMVQQPAEPKKSSQKLQVDDLDGKLVQLITFHKENNDILRGIKAILFSNRQLHKKMNQLLKINFSKMERSMNQSQKASKGREDIMDLRLKSILNALEDLRDSLIENRQDSPTSDDSDGDPGLGQSSGNTCSSSPAKAGKRKLI